MLPAGRGCVRTWRLYDPLQVPSDIIISGWENKKVGFTQTKRDATHVSLATAGDTTVTLTFKPFKLSVYVKGQEAVVLNSRNLFNFEHRRAKSVSGWAHARTWQHAGQAHAPAQCYGQHAPLCRGEVVGQG